jgi:hypothetical protein
VERTMKAARYFFTGISSCIKHDRSWIHDRALI